MENGCSIDSVLFINSDAYFGRELYQRHLVAYFLAKDKSIPMDTSRWVRGRERGDPDELWIKNSLKHEVVRM